MIFTLLAACGSGGTDTDVDMAKPAERSLSAAELAGPKATALFGAKHSPTGGAPRPIGG